MTIRTAHVGDVEAIVEMGREFIHAIYPNDLPFNAGQIAQTALNLMASQDGEIFVAERDGALIGMLAMIAFLHPLSGERIATELCWWVSPSHRGVGVKLLRAAEAWTKAQGAAVFQMIAPSPEVGRFYERVGLHAIETSYQRRVA
jgi:GNAT superfamily N-acetyltransferase